MYCLGFHEKEISASEELKHIAHYCVIIRTKQLELDLKYGIKDFGKLTKGCLQISKKDTALKKVMLKTLLKFSLIKY